MKIQKVCGLSLIYVCKGVLTKEITFKARFTHSQILQFG